MPRTDRTQAKDAFYTVPRAEWRFGPGIDATRKRCLEAAESYGSIVSQIERQARLISHGREKGKKGNYFRAWVTLSVPQDTVDRFHNSASGYRAQYYRSTHWGERANEYTLNRLAGPIVGLLNGVAKRTCPLWWVERSLLDPAAKIWIHQGRWLRFARLDDRQLRVARWMEHLGSVDANIRKKALWASLTPREFRIDVKGGFLSLSGERREHFKPGRSDDLHRLGFT
jgi:hypothetical protein